MASVDYLSQLTADTKAAVMELMAWAEARGISAKITSARRTCAEQVEIYARGRTEPGQVVSWVSGCKSWHVHGRAVDLYLGTYDPAAYTMLGEHWEQMGGRWGGRFKDGVHFEWHPGLDINEVCPYPMGVCPTAAKVGIALGVGLAVAGVVAGSWMWARS